jgi:predicted nucleotidyltransferase
MDPGSRASPLNPAGSLDVLASRAGVTFAHVEQARSLAADRIADASAQLTDVTPADVSVVMFGSWARGELTDGSDNDWAILTPDGRAADPDVETLVARCRRMLTLLESVALSGGARDECWQAIFDRYLGWGVKDHSPPRFLLNDVIRYWRTICVDFEGKHRTSGGEDPKWVMRNAKLRTSRKMLFAGGLLPVLFCRLRELDEIRGFLAQQLTARPLDRVAWAFLEMDLVPEGPGVSAPMTNGSRCSRTPAFVQRSPPFEQARAMNPPSSPASGRWANAFMQG